MVTLLEKIVVIIFTQNNYYAETSFTTQLYLANIVTFYTIQYNVLFTSVLALLSLLLILKQKKGFTIVLKVTFS